MTDPDKVMINILFEIVTLEIKTFRLRESVHQQAARRNVKPHDFHGVMSNTGLLETHTHSP